MKSYEIIPEIVPKLPEYIKGWRLILYSDKEEIDGGMFQSNAEGYSKALEKAENFVTDIS